MAPKTKPSTNFTESELKLGALAWQAIDGGEFNVKLDFKKLARLGGWTEGSAKTLWGNYKKKLKSVVEANAAATTTEAAGEDKGGEADTTDVAIEPKPATRGRARKRNATPEASIELPPAKRSKKIVIKSEEKDGDVEEDGN